MSIAAKIVSRLLEDEPLRWDTSEEADALPHQLVNMIVQMGGKALYEHPGYASIPTSPGYLAVGTVNGFWGCDLPEEVEPAKAQPILLMWEPLLDRDPVSVDPSELLALINETVRHLGDSPA